MERKKVIQYQLNGAVVATYDSVRSAAKAIHRDPKAVTLSCKGHSRNCAGYVFRFHNEPFVTPFSPECQSKEKWSAVRGYEGYYEVSISGEVRSVDRFITHSEGKYHIIKSKLMSKSLRTDGYYMVCLHKDGVKHSPAIHRLVAETFIPNPYNLPCVDHIDGNRLNNNVDNLRWCTQSENNSFPLACKRKSDNWNPATRKPVLVYNKDGELLGRFESVKKASEFTGIRDTNLSSMLTGRINSKKFTFKYEEKCK